MKMQQKAAEGFVLHNIVFGTAYYPEYMPYERMDTDMQLMKQAGMNTIRVGESTWSTWEPHDGEFHFELLKRTIETAQKYELSVIIGTPTYAVPAWLVKKYPEILAKTHNGSGFYGHRQNMDIANPKYLFYAERIIRKMMEQVSHYPNVIGYQLDNETKAYDTCSVYAQQKFITYLQEKFASIEEMNAAFGLSYWSNSVHSWEDFPDIRGTINGSLGAEYERFQRKLVTDFLAWQSSLIKEYARKDQFLTHNFDYDWRDYSYGMQPEVNQFEAVKALTIPGFDLYHPSQNLLTGAEISFGGAIGRAVAKAVDQTNYFILETEAQGNVNWLPYPNQLRLQGYSHLANGSDSVMYWHWHSIHNAIESYWKGILSHDLKENATYYEVKKIGQEFQKIEDSILHLTKNNDVAIMTDNHSLTGIKWFPISETLKYNDVVRWFADALYEMNVEYDVISSEETDLSAYQVIITPAMYSVSAATRNRLRDFVQKGGHLIASFKSFFCNEHLQIAWEEQPFSLTDCFGMTYNQFTKPVDVHIKFDGRTGMVSEWMELLCVTTAESWSSYQSIPYLGYSCITHNKFGKGTATYIGCYLESNMLKKVLKKALRSAGIPLPNYHFPLILRKGINQFGNDVTYYFNYSGDTISTHYDGEKGYLILYNDELMEQVIEKGEILKVKPWNLAIVVEHSEM